MVALYDPISDKIYGCKKGTKAWWHERGHQELNHSGESQALGMESSVFFYIAVVCLALNLNLPALGALLVIAYCQTKEERLAWAFAKKNRARWTDA